MAHIWRICLLILVIWLLPLTGLAEPDNEWSYSFGEPAYGDVQDIVNTPDGGSIAYGSNGSSPSALQMWLVKLDADGNIEWENVYGTDGSQAASSIALTSDGGYILAGSRWRDEDQSIAVHKVSGAGEREWSHLMGYGSQLGNPVIYERYDGGFVVFFAVEDDGLKGIQPALLDRDGSHGGIVSLIEAPLGNADVTTLKFTVRETSDGGYVLRVPIKWGWLPLGMRTYRISPNVF